MSPAVVGAETGAGAGAGAGVGTGHGAAATLLRFVSSFGSSAENALTAKRTSGSDPVKMHPGALFVEGFVSEGGLFFPSFFRRRHRKGPNQPPARRAV